MTRSETNEIWVIAYNNESNNLIVITRQILMNIFGNFLLKIRTYLIGKIGIVFWLKIFSFFKRILEMESERTQRRKDKVHIKIDF